LKRIGSVTMGVSAALGTIDEIRQVIFGFDNHRGSVDT
jgi:hypothetical protein